MDRVRRSEEKEVGSGGGRGTVSEHCLQKLEVGYALAKLLALAAVCQTKVNQPIRATNR